MAATSPVSTSLPSGRSPIREFYYDRRENILLAIAVAVFAAYPFIDEWAGWGRLGSWGAILRGLYDGVSDLPQ